jgi:hypothetical protein
LYSKLTVRREVVKKHKTNRLPQGNKIKTNQKPLRFFARALVALFVVVSLPLSASLLAPSSSVSAATGINHQINFQGKLVNPDGTNVTDGSYSIVYSIYSVPTAGTALWTETQTVTLANGIFQVNLGSVTPLPGSVDFNTDNIYLGIKVGADAEMTPRVQFTAVPQAFNAEKLGGVDKTGFIQNTTSPQTASFNVTGSGAIGTTLAVTGATTLSSTLAVTGAVTGGTYNGQTISSAASLTGTLAVTGATTLSSTLALTGNLTQTTGATISAGTGYKINGAAATAGTFLRGDGTNFVASTLQSGDITGGSTNYIQNTTTQQAASNVNISGAGVIGTTLSVAGTSSFGGAINLGAASTTTGQIKLYTSTNTGSVTLQGAATNGNYTVSIPNTIAANDTFCLLTAGNCGSSISLGALNGGTANANGATISAGILYLQSASALYAGLVDIAAQTFAGAKTFTANTTVANTSATAFQVQNTSGTQIFGVDTSAGQALLGKASTLNGALALYNATNANNITIQTGVTSASYTITLAAAAGTAGQCLTVASVTSGNQTLGYGSCGGGGGGTQAITLAPEFAGATFSASGTNNVGTMYSDHVGGLTLAQGYKHNYYQWSTDQATAQNYDVVASYQLPSNFSSFATGTFKIWVYADSLTSTNINFDLRSNTDADCYASVQSVKPSASATWQQVTIADPGNGCSFAANDVITIDIKATAITPNTNYVKIGELQFRYN